MARLPGLRPIEEDRPSVRGRNKARVQTPEPRIRPPSLTPVAAPVDTYSRPEAPQQDNGWLSLSRALADINPAINNFLQFKSQTDKEDSLARAQRILLSRPYDEVREGIKNGTIPEFQDAKSMELWGQHAAFERYKLMQEFYATDFDKEGGDLEAFFREQMAADLEVFGNDRLFVENYYKTLQPMLDRFRLNHSEFLSNRTLETRADTQFNVWFEKAKFESAEGVAPADIAASIFGDFQSNKDLLRLSFKEQQAMVLQMAERAATRGDYDLAEALLSHERESDGMKFSLLNDRELGDKANNLAQRIADARQKEVWQREAEEAQQLFGVILDDAVDAGRIPIVGPVELPDGKGGTKEVSERQVRDQAAQRTLERSAQIAVERGETPEQTFDRELTQFSVNGLVHPQWKEVLTSGYQGAMGGTVNAQEMPPALEKGYELYAELHSKNPRYLGTLLPKDALEYYEAVRIGQQYGRQNLQQAHANALVATRDPAKFDTPYFRQRFEEIENAVNELTTSAWFGLFGSDAVNKGDVGLELTRMASLYTKMGLSPDESLDLAKTQFKDTYININGWYVYAGDRHLPANAPELFEDIIRSYVEKHGELEGIDYDDLSVRPLGNTGAWEIFHKYNLWTVHDRNDGVITMDTLKAVQDRKDDELIQETLRKAQGEDLDLQKAWVNIPRYIRHTRYGNDIERFREERQAQGQLYR